jgi:hypothetical protein
VSITGTGVLVSTAGAAATTGGAGCVTRGCDSVTVLVVGGGVGIGVSTWAGLTGAATGAGSCFKYIAETNAKEFVGVSICIQSPLEVTSLTVAPFSIMPSTL